MSASHLTPGELAQRWRMQVKTLSNWRAKGRGPAYLKVGHGVQARVVYPQDAVEAYEQAGVRLPNQEAAK